MSKAILFAILRLFYHYRVMGGENVPKDGGVILAPNHVSYWDPPVAGCVTRRKVYFMAKEELFHVPILKYWIKRVGCIPVRRGTADRRALRLAAEHLKKGGCVLVFPEGKRVSPGEVKEGELGIALLAQMAGVPVVPIGITGTQPLFRKICGVLPWFSKIRVHVGKPLLFSFPNKAHERTKAFEEAVHVIMNEIQRLKTEKLT